MTNPVHEEIIRENERDLMTLTLNENIPHIIKYMGSKRKIIDYVIEGINECYTGGTVVDLFAGSSVLAGALRGQTPFVANDIQEYSSVLAKTYLGNYHWDDDPNILEEIIEKATIKVNYFNERYPDISFDYNVDFTLSQFNELEKKQQELIERDFSDIEYHLFLKYYSGTYWNFEQCLWIDSIRGVAEEYKDSDLYYPIISSLMFAMSYNSQSTGHYAQYRDATNNKNMNDILIYRRKEIVPYFIRKFTEFQNVLQENQQPSNVVSKDYIDCLNNIEFKSTVYADPPYCFVHYSRFYHAIETLVRYDYPEVKYKGRYRTDRHQSPFCIRSQVRSAFERMFAIINERESNLVLSYSNTGMIKLDEIIELAVSTFDDNYTIQARSLDYLHSTMGRKEDKSREVQECLLLVKRNN
ncbi:DNA adenine methylase [Bacillus velezensis]|uniref:DNA adenine methylase n=1 Tax=Bacillus velezensis TaxID=492670 RepID=UPI000A888B4F|nr:DNA adenine methylase [Bacillus velezensis]MEC2277817.1 DNA adenine methylase [Bacillus velezensis]MED3703638.1 DNA adenine methylase [Bacillus velezensis]